MVCILQLSDKQQKSNLDSSPKVRVVTFLFLLRGVHIVPTITAGVVTFFFFVCAGGLSVYS